MEEDFFSHFGLKRAFNLDKSILKKRYYAKSRALHPDFFAQASASEIEKMEALTAYNNLAYKTLSTDDKRLAYILDLEGLMKEEKPSLPQSFLMEMMEVNESLMELEFAFDAEKKSVLEGEIMAIEQALNEGIESILAAYDKGERSSIDLGLVKDFYLKRKYLWRLKENLDKFASS